MLSTFQASLRNLRHDMHGAKNSKQAPGRNYVRKQNMKIAAIPENEEKRLKALQDLNLLDSVPEQEFQEIVELASYIAETPISLISLVDEKRQWFKAKVGLEATETPREVAFCSHAILGEGAFEVPDSDKDPRFFDNPLVTGAPFVKFYLGHPIRVRDGQQIGTLCVIDHQPRKLSKDQYRCLEMLSNQLQKLLDLRLSQIERANEILKLKYYSTAVRSMSDGLVLQDKSGAIISHNLSAERVLGLTEDQLLGRTSVDPRWRSVHEDGTDFPGIEHPSMVCLRTGKSQIDVPMGIHQPNGSLRWINVCAEPIVCPDSSEVIQAVSCFRDVTEQKQNQLLLLQSAKLTSLGEMAAGVAHEINTPLTIISSSTQLVLKQLRKEDTDKDYCQEKLAKIESTVARVAKIIKGLRNFSRDSQSEQAQEHKLVPLLEESASFCFERFSNYGIDLTLESTGDPVVSCVPTELMQVVINLLNNAFDALNSLGQVDPLLQKWVRIEVESKSPWVVLRVVDSGSGIPSEVVKKMMNPFYTTKPYGQGTGLGLSISRSLISRVGGEIRYELYNGNTSFVVQLKNATEVTENLIKGAS